MKTKTLKPNRNNIETYLPIFTGFYGSQWDEPDFYGEAEHFGLPENFDFTAFFNYRDYQNALSKYFCDCVESDMKKWIERIDFQSLQSPKEYNFTNDSINCIIRPKTKEISAYIYANKEQFSKYLETHLKSRSGFMSFHSYDFETWEENTNKFKSFDKSKDNRGFNLGFILSFIAENEGLEENNVFEDASSNVFVSEYLNQDFYDLVKDMDENEFINRDNLIEAKQTGCNLLNIPEQIEFIKKFVRENYTKPNVKELALNEFSEIETGFYDTLSDFIYIERVIDWQIKEIENKTLSLYLK